MWAGRRYHLGTNKEAFNAEAYAIYQALRILDQEQGRPPAYHLCGFRRRHREDQVGQHRPRSALRGRRHRGLRQAESRSNEFTVRCVLAHHGALGNEKTDEHVKAAAEGQRPITWPRTSTGGRPACPT